MKILFFILIAYLAYVIIKGQMRGEMSKRPRKPDTAPEEHIEGGEEMVQDPVCKSYIPISTAVTAQRNHEKIYFCSPECRDKFSAGPEQ